MLDAQTDEVLEAGPESKKSLRLWLHLYKCAKQLEQEMSDRFRESYACSFSRFDVLAHLYEAGAAGLSTSSLAARLLASKGNITRLLDRMEEDKLLERKLSSADRRVSNIYLSAHGRVMFEKMAADHEAWAAAVFEVLPAAEKEHLLALLKQIRARFN